MHRQDRCEDNEICRTARREDRPERSADEDIAPDALLLVPGTKHLIRLPIYALHTRHSVPETWPHGDESEEDEERARDDLPESSRYRDEGGACLKEKREEEDRETERDADDEESSTARLLRDGATNDDGQ